MEEPLVVLKIKGSREHSAHARCLDDFNETMQCGLDRGHDCKDPKCYFSSTYVHKPSDNGTE